MKTYAYFPGCSLQGMGRPYDESVRAVFARLGLGLEEIPDWNCCGATSYMSVDQEKAVALASRNLALAEAMKKDVVAPCSACYLVLIKAQRLIGRYPDLADRTKAGLKRAGLSYHGMVKVRHPLDVLVNDLGSEDLARQVTRPLTGFRLATYYGCQVVRPFAAFDDALKPTTMDRLMVLAGATTVPYPLKTRCCGGSLMGTIEEVGVRLNFLLLKEARARGAQALVTLCPLCQYNLEAFQHKMTHRFGEDVHLPVVYFTQLLGLALGIDAKALGLGRNLTVLEPMPVPA